MTERQCDESPPEPWSSPGSSARSALHADDIAELIELSEHYDPSNPEYGQILLRAGEAHREVVDAETASAWQEFDRCMTGWNACTSDVACYEPIPRYATAVDLLRRSLEHNLADDYASYALYRRVDAQWQMDERDAARADYEELLSAYPSSEYIEDARVIVSAD